jgi:hypothetical protein
MGRNAFLGMSYLGTHPAFSWARAAVVCPICNVFETTRTREYDKHFLAHNPSQEVAERWLSWKTYRRVATKRDWRTPERVTSAPDSHEGGTHADEQQEVEG